MVAALGGVAQVLRNGTAPQRAEVYASLGLVLTYDDRTKKLHVSADLEVSLDVSEGDLTGYSTGSGIIVGPELWLPEPRN